MAIRPNRIRTGIAATVLLLATNGCGESSDGKGETAAGGQTHTGGSGGSSRTFTTAGTEAVGGNSIQSAAGGSQQTGGTNTTSLSTSRAGAAGTESGGTSSNGGLTSRGGSSANGGLTSRGGSSGIGGTTTRGGATAAGGTTSRGGSSGVSGSVAIGGKSTGGSTGTSIPNRSNGCGKSAPLSAAAQQTTTVSGTSRSYFLSPPTGYNSSTAYPLVFVFHGAGDNGANMRGWSGLEQAASGGAIFVFPDGLGGIWDLDNNGPDTLLFDQVVATLGEAWCIDKAAIYAAGFSYGGWAATQMAVARPTVVRAVASIAGGGPQGGKSTDPAVPALLVHGTADTAELIASSISTRAHFIATNGCGSASTATTPSPCVAYAGCQTGKPVVWCQHAEGHTIPNFAPSGIWNFFMSVR